MSTREMNEEDVRSNLITFFRGNAALTKANNLPVSISKITAKLYLNDSLDKPIKVSIRAYLRDFLDVDYIESDEQTWLSSAFVDLSEKLESSYEARKTAREQKLDKLRYEAARLGFDLVEKEGGAL